MDSLERRVQAQRDELMRNLQLLDDLNRNPTKAREALSRIDRSLLGKPPTSAAVDITPPVKPVSEMVLTITCRKQCKKKERKNN
jgi:hypothetical protein